MFTISNPPDKKLVNSTNVQCTIDGVGCRLKTKTTNICSTLLHSRKDSSHADMKAALLGLSPNPKDNFLPADLKQKRSRMLARYQTCHVIY